MSSAWDRSGTDESLVVTAKSSDQPGTNEQGRWTHGKSSHREIGVPVGEEALRALTFPVFPLS